MLYTWFKFYIVFFVLLMKMTWRVFVLHHGRFRIFFLSKLENILSNPRQFRIEILHF